MVDSQQKNRDIGNTLHRLRDRILDVWSKRCRAEVEPAADLDHPILIDTMPLVIEHLAKSLSTQPLGGAVELVSVAQEHGSERARLTDFDPTKVIQEYLILRDVVLDELENEIPLEQVHIKSIHRSFDAAICEATAAFALAHANIREQFVAALTHDLRSPILAALLATELIHRKSPQNQEVLNLTQKIDSNLRRADSLIQDLLDSMAVKSGSRLDLVFEEVDLADLAREVAENHPEVKERFRLETKSVKGYWDPGAMKRALENLIANAMKYSEPGSEITIKTDVTHQRAMLTVHNFGPEIPHHDRELIFQVFRRSQASREGRKPGWGIGLSVVRAVAESHGGSIGLDSNAERGTTFTMDFPVDARPYASAPILQ